MKKMLELKRKMRKEKDPMKEIIKVVKGNVYSMGQQFDFGKQKVWIEVLSVLDVTIFIRKHEKLN